MTHQALDQRLQQYPNPVQKIEVTSKMSYSIRNSASKSNSQMSVHGISGQKIRGDSSMSPRKTTQPGHLYKETMSPIQKLKKANAGRPVGGTAFKSKALDKLQQEYETPMLSPQHLNEVTESE